MIKGGKMRYTTILLASMLFMLQGCYEKFDSKDDNITRPVTSGDWYKPAKQVKWSWQMSTDVDSVDEVEVYVVDLFKQGSGEIEAIKSDSNKVMCMFHSAQVNDDDPDQDKYSDANKGGYVDANETTSWLNITLVNVQNNILKRVDLAKEKGCDGVVPRDTDMYSLSDTGISIDAAKQESFNKKLANYAHDNNLSVGLEDSKNQISTLVEYYDFAVVNECYANEECDSYKQFIDSDKPVLDAEFNKTYYTDTTMQETVCSDAKARGFSTILVSSDLNNTYQYSCD